MRVGTALDLHVHTTVGSLDSSLRPETLAAALETEGLHGALVAEHLTPWPERVIEEHRRGDQLLMAGIELAFGADHVLVLAPSPISLALAGRLREAATAAEAAIVARAETGVMLVLAHPFRYHRERWQTDAPVQAVAGRELLDHIHAVEAVNGGCTDEENQMAFDLARLRGLPITGGSDAHEGRAVGYAVTQLRFMAATPAEVIEMVLSGQSEIQVRQRGRRFRWDGIGEWEEARQ